MSLNPTRIRLDLLAAASRGEVYHEAGQWWLRPAEVRVTAAVGDQRHAEWLRADPPASSGKTLANITTTGRCLLSEHNRCGRCGAQDLAISECSCGLWPHAHADYPQCPTWVICESCRQRLVAADQQRQDVAS